MQQDTPLMARGTAHQLTATKIIKLKRKQYNCSVWEAPVRRESSATVGAGLRTAKLAVRYDRTGVDSVFASARAWKSCQHNLMEPDRRESTSCGNALTRYHGRGTQRSYEIETHPVLDGLLFFQTKKKQYYYLKIIFVVSTFTVRIYKTAHDSHILTRL